MKENNTEKGRKRRTTQNNTERDRKFSYLLPCSVLFCVVHPLFFRGYVCHECNWVEIEILRLGKCDCGVAKWVAAYTYEPIEGTHQKVYRCGRCDNLRASSLHKNDEIDHIS